MNAKPMPCPCGGAVYGTCCGRFHNGAPAPDAAALMRSRYSAYALRLQSYLLASWHHSTRPAVLDLADDNTKWIALEVRNHLCVSANRATVEFVARYRTGGRAARLHEVSRFVREDGRWFYLDGEFIGRT